MSGNVWEWVEDTYHRYPKELQLELTDYIRRGDKHRVYRGGGFEVADPTHLCCDYRSHGWHYKAKNHPWSNDEVGVRLARSE
jgi:formylglycine-generating enzyme required for sulfatase activity